MKYGIIYFTLWILTFCADDVGDNEHTLFERIVRANVWPLTILSWFRSQNVRLHRLLNILWTVLIAGWLISLMADRL